MREGSSLPHTVNLENAISCDSQVILIGCFRLLSRKEQYFAEHAIFTAIACLLGFLAAGSSHFRIRHESFTPIKPTSDVGGGWVGLEKGGKL